MPGQRTLQQQLETGISHHRTARLDEAEAIYRQILAQQSNHVDALHLLGVLIGQRGQYNAGVDLIRRAIRLQPDFALAYSNLGKALAKMGRFTEAIDSFRQATRLKPDDADAHNNLGNALMENEQLGEAIASFRQAIRFKPNYAEAHNNLGNVFKSLGRLEEAVDCIRQAIRLKPDFAEAHFNLGNILRDTGHLGEAISLCRHAIQLNPHLAEAHNSLGGVLQSAGQIDEAVASFRQAIRLKPDFAEAHNNLGFVITSKGLLDEAIDSLREAIRIKPDFVEAHSNMIYTLQFHSAYNGRMIQEELRRWNQQHALPLRKFIQAHTNNRDPDRRLHIGYVSPDFRNHVVGQNLLPLLRAHDRRQLEIFCYTNSTRADALTEQIRGCADAWRSIAGLSDSQAVDLIREDRIDILVDLTVHLAHNRLLVFARKPAPVQVTYLGYCSSTGLETMDYRLSDPHLDPLDSDLSIYTEQTIRLPETYWCYNPGGPAPEPSPVPAGTTGYIAFGCLNNFAKVSPAALDLWAEILQCLPRSQLIIHSHLGTHLDIVRN